MTIEEHVESLQGSIDNTKGLLEDAKAKIAAVAILEAYLARLEAAKLALAAPQTPSGRKRIADGQRKRKGKEAPKQVIPVKCAECHEVGGSASHCTAPECDAFVCNGCLARHQDRFHSEQE